MSKEEMWDSLTSIFTVTVDDNGTRRWRKNGKLHRIDGPAVEWFDGDNFWYREGLTHREDGPAIETVDGLDKWFIHGQEYTKQQFNVLQGIKKKK